MFPHMRAHGRTAGGSGAFRHVSASAMPGPGASSRASGAAEEEDAPDGLAAVDGRYSLPLSCPPSLPSPLAHPLLLLASYPLPAAPSTPPVRHFPASLPQSLLNHSLFPPHTSLCSAYSPPASQSPSCLSPSLHARLHSHHPRHKHTEAAQPRQASGEGRERECGGRGGVEDARVGGDGLTAEAITHAAMAPRQTAGRWQPRLGPELALTPSMKWTGERDGRGTLSGRDCDNASDSDCSEGDWEQDEERGEESYSGARGGANGNEAERLECVWSFIRHHPPSRPLMPRLLSWRPPLHLSPPTPPSSAAQSTHGYVGPSSCSSRHSTGGAMLDQRLVMLLARRLKERHRHHHALELLQWNMARRSSPASPHSPCQQEQESQSGSGDMEREEREREECELMDGLARCGRWGDARDAFLALPSHARTDKVYSGVLYHLARTGQHSGLQQELQWVQETAGAALGVCSFNARLLALSCLPARSPHASSVLQRMDATVQEMREKGISPSLFTYHILLRQCMEQPTHTLASMLPRLNALLHAMRHCDHLLPSAQTHSILLRALIHAGQLSRAENTFNAMMEDGLVPAPAACAALWMAMGRAGKGGRGGEVEGMWRRVQGMGVRVTRPMHVARIAAHATAGDIPMAEEAFGVLHVRSARLDRDACTALLKGYTRASMSDAALRLVDAMHAACIPSSTATLSLLLSCLTRSHRLAHATALVTQLTSPAASPPASPSAAPPPATTTSPAYEPHPNSLPGFMPPHTSPSPTPQPPSQSHHRAQPPRGHAPAIKRRVLRGLMVALQAEGHVEGVRHVMHAGEAMWGRAELAWYKTLLGAMVRRAEGERERGEGGEGGSGGRERWEEARWEEEARGVEEEMREKGVKGDHEVRGLLRRLRGVAGAHQECTAQ
ncbi:hypothetical protein CLOP_g24862 [Closterium sp. NIES-67]|nr:hypothetical protein CLOP_g24862 [Closterium sp. NIES-67]